MYESLKTRNSKNVFKGIHAISRRIHSANNYRSSVDFEGNWENRVKSVR